jgi:quinate dehydrogenase
VTDGMRGRPGVVIGGGGTCRAAVYASKVYLGCEEVYLVNREQGECETVIADCKAKGFGRICVTSLPLRKLDHFLLQL